MMQTISLEFAFVLVMFFLNSLKYIQLCELAVKREMKFFHPEIIWPYHMFIEWIVTFEKNLNPWGEGGGVDLHHLKKIDSCVKFPVTIDVFYFK